MPVKLNWKKDQSLGLALMYLGIMGILQIIFMFIGQYWIQIGVKPIIILIPIGVIAATFYSVIVIFESSTTMADYRNTHKFTSKKKKNTGTFKEKLIKFLSNYYVKPVALVTIMFTITFLISCMFTFLWFSRSTMFLIADNLSAIIVMIFATMNESKTKKKTR